MRVMNRPDSARARLAEACSELVRHGRVDRSGDAEDAVQEACVRALEHTAPQAVRDPVRYMARVARNWLIDRRRRLKRETALFDALGDSQLVCNQGLDPERITGGEQRLARALATIAALPPRCREAFELHRFEGVNYVGIARRMGISVSMVEKHIAEALLRLTQALEDPVAESSQWETRP